MTVTDAVVSKKYKPQQQNKQQKIKLVFHLHSCVKKYLVFFF